MYTVFKKPMAERNVPVANIVGLGSDGANVMLGEHNSFQTRLSGDTETLALTEIQNRLPLSDELFLEMEFLDPNIALSKKRPAHLNNLDKLLNKFSTIVNDKNGAAVEWRSLPHLFEDSEQQNLKELPIDKFWFQISRCTNFNNSPLFKNIAQLANLTLFLPHSNTKSERIFSVMNDIKTRKRNKMEKGILNAISIVRSHKISALNYHITDEHCKKNGK